MDVDCRMINQNTAHFHIYYKKEDTTFAEKLMGKIEGFFADVCRQVCIKPGDEQYDLYICGTAEEFIAYTGKSEEEYEDWMVGNADSIRNRLCVASPRLKGDFSADYEEYLIKVMLHETVHMVFDRLCPPERCDIWIAEGIAVCLAGQMDARCLSTENYPKVRELGGKTDMSAFAYNGGYAYSGVYVWYLLERYGMEKFISLYRGECSGEALSEENFEYKAITAYQEQKGNF